MPWREIGRAARRAGGRSGVLCLLLLATWLPPTAHSDAGAPRRVTGGDGSGRLLDLAREVDPFIGTGVQRPVYANGGASAFPGSVLPAFTFPGAALPFGMLQWSPDTSSERMGGYTYGDRAIYGFSLTHLSGVGCMTYRDIPFMPAPGPPTVSPATDPYAYAATFAHGDETATPGYYGVRLGSGVHVELTATARTGLGRFTYPAATAGGTLLINAGGSANGDSTAGVRIDSGTNTVTGWATSGGFCHPPGNLYTVYFAVQFDRPFAGYGTWDGPALVPGARAAAGARSGAYLTFDTARGPVVRTRVGISFVSARNALGNLRSEGRGWDFAATRGAATATWNKLLNRVQVGGGTAADRRTFYTALYHALLHPNIYSDSNGEYLGFDGKVHAARGAVQYTNYSGWDIYRSQIPLLALLAPREASDMAQSLVNDARQGGALPRWPLASADTGIMVGDPAAPIIAGAYAFGASHFDARAALRSMVANATNPGLHPHGVVARPGLAEYLKLGYVPSNDFWVWGTVATTLEYTTADFAIAQLAGALGEAATHETFLRRSATWRRLFNPATGYVQPRRANGQFVTPFDPTAGDGFVEGNAAQYVWMAPYDLRGLADALGGRAHAARRLDTFFTAVNAGPTAPYAYMGNEPSAGVPWVYDALGQPWRTQATVRRIMRELYTPTPDGLPGNDDLGHLSAWYVFAALGLYPATPGAPILALGSPLFPRVTLRLTGGDVTIAAPAASDATPYVERLTLDEHTYRKPWLPLSALAHGARLQFALDSRPHTSWGSAPADAPPSFSPEGR